MINVSADSTSFILTAHPRDKDRIKALPGGKWDTELKVWRVPLRRDALEQLHEQFDPSELEFDAHACAKALPLTEDYISLTEEGLKRDRELIEAYGIAVEQSDRHAEAIAQLIEATSLLARISDAARNHGLAQDASVNDIPEFLENLSPLVVADSNQSLEIAMLRERLASANDKISRLESEQGASDADLAANSLIQFACKNGSLEAEGREALRDLSLSRDAPIALAIHAQRYLERRLGTEGKRSNFVETIGRAREQGLITELVANFAHTLRIQRNLAAHEEVPKNEIELRAAIALAAYLGLVLASPSAPPAEHQ